MTDGLRNALVGAAAVVILAVAASFYIFRASPSDGPEFPDWSGSYLNTQFKDKFTKAFECIGRADGKISSFSSGARVAGWAWAVESSKPIDKILAVNADGKIIGAGHGGFSRPDVKAATPNVTSENVGWQADTTVASGPIDFYGLSDDPAASCHIGQLTI
jgi:hypothetical protein